MKTSGFPILDEHDRLSGVLTRRDLLASHARDTQLAALIRREPVVSYADWSLREAADQMGRERIGRLPVVLRTEPGKVIGILTRSDLVDVHAHRLAAHVLTARPGATLVDATTAREVIGSAH